MAKAKKLPSGNWRVRVYAGKDEAGKNRYKSFTATSKKEAEAAAALWSVEKKHREENGMTVGEAIDAYIRSKENVLSPTTIRGYQANRKNHLQGIMHISLRDLTNRDIQTEVNKESQRLSPKTLRNAHGLLSAALAVYLPDFVLRTTLPAKQHKIKDLPNVSEVMQAVRGEEIELPVMLALWLSLRMSEVRGLRYSDISGDILTVRSTIVTIDGEHIERQQTKTYLSTRQLRVPPYILHLIEQSHAGATDVHIVTLTGSAIYERFKKLLRRKGVKPMTFHDLRHLNASVMHELGVPDKYAMERGGWSSNHTLQNVYQHTFSKKRQEVDEQIDAYFSSLLSANCELPET